MIARSALALVPFLVLGCGGSSPQAAAPGGSSWSYEEGAEGPAHWGALDPAFAACASGKAQSPIDLPARPPQAPGRAPAAPKWSAVPVRVINDGHTIEVEAPTPSSFVFEGTTYALQGFHFHSPSEHTINGRAFEVEAHFVHRSPDGKTLVLALLFGRGRENELLRPMFDAIPSTANVPPVDTGKTLDPSGLLPKAPRYVRYDGSLTVPPCTEGVTWLVVEPDADVPLQMSVAQIGRLRAAMHGPSNRPAQPLDGRPVYELVP